MNCGNNKKHKNKPHTNNTLRFDAPDFDYRHPEKGALNENKNDNDNDYNPIPRIDLTHTSDDSNDDDDDVAMMIASGDKEEKTQNESIEFINKMKQKLKAVGIPKQIRENAATFISLALPVSHICVMTIYCRIMIKYLALHPGVVKKIGYKWLAWVVKEHPYELRQQIFCTRNRNVEPFTLTIGILYI